MAGVNARIAAISDDGVAALRPALEAAKRELQKALTEWLRTAPNAEARFTAQHLRSALLQVDAALRAVKRLHPQMAEGLRFRSKILGRYSVEDVMAQVAEFSSRFGTPLVVDLDTAALIARGDRMLIPQYEASALRYAGRVGSDIRLQLGIGVLRGETFGELKHRLAGLGSFRAAVRPSLGSAEETAALSGERLFRKYGFWAERVVRTELMHGYNLQHGEATREVAKLDDEIGERWDSAGDFRRCELCRTLDGQFRKVDQWFSAMGLVFKQPPAHPLCRCIRVTWRKDWG